MNDTCLVDRPHQTAVYILRQIKPYEKANLVIRRRLQVEEYTVSFHKEKEGTALGLVVGERPLLFDQVMLKLFLHIKNFLPTHRDSKHLVL